MEDSIKIMDGSSSALICRPDAADSIRVRGVYHVQCVSSSGVIVWTDKIQNLVVNAGKNQLLDTYLSGSSWSTGTVYMGLKGAGTVNALDTMTSHLGWAALNITAARAAVSFAAASGGVKATSAPSSNLITAAGPTTVAGCFIVVGGTSSNTDTTGTLFSAGDFSGGSRSVIAGDTLNVTYSVST